jgi:lipid-binding SYLF domain-containing protein
MFVAIDGGSVGYQIGGSSTDLILLFMNDHALSSLLSDKFKLGADASVAAGPIGRSAAADTDIKLHSEILSYSRSKGVFAGVSLDGAVVQADKEPTWTDVKFWTARCECLFQRRISCTSFTHTQVELAGCNRRRDEI